MNNMSEQDIADYLVKNIKPWVDSRGTFYRVSATLKDSTHISCVMIGNPAERLSQAKKLLDELDSSEESNDQGIRSFLFGDSMIEINEIIDVSPSPYAWPLELLDTIHGETTMGWTAFTVLMKDGSLFPFGTNYYFQFFDLPEGYTHQDILEIHSGKILTSEGEEEDFSFEKKAKEPFRDRHFFYSYSDWLPE